MAAILTAKAATEVVDRRWAVPVDADDAPESVALVATDITVDASEFDGHELVLTLSAGTSGTTASIIATVTTDRARTLVETLYIPIIASASPGETVTQIVGFALRKIEGLGITPEATATDDAIERLTDMLREWRASGADIGAPDVLTAATVLYCPASFIKAVKNNLIIELADLYGAEPGGRVIQNARSGLAHIRQKNMPDERPGADYF